MPHTRNLRETGTRIEQLLAELRTVADTRIQEQAEELVHLLVEVYGAGLTRTVEIIETEDVAGQDLVRRLTEDELVASLLVLHGLHPDDLATRVHNALEKVRPYLGSHAGGVELLGVDDDGVVHLRLEGTCNGCPSSTVTVKLAIERAIEEAAPEVTRVEVEGVVEPSSANVISLDSIRRNSAKSNGHGSLSEPAATWTEVDGVAGLAPGELKTTSVEQARVVVCNVDGALYAYGNVCPACGSGWSTAGLAAEILTCPTCRQRYDVRLAGRGIDRAEYHLDPFPLLNEGQVVQIAIPGAVV